MEQRDYLKDQIDQMARVLGVLLAKLAGLSSDTLQEQFTDLIESSLMDELDIDIEKLVDQSIEDMLLDIQARKLNDISLEKLAEVLFIYAEKSNMPMIKEKNLLKVHILLLMC